MEHEGHFARRDGELPQQWLLYVLLICAGGTALTLHGWTAFWTPLHVQTMSPPFADLRSIQGGLVSLARGSWPQLAYPGDPWGRTMDYPSAWLWLARVLRFRNEGAFPAFGTSSVLLFVGACTYLLASYPSWIMLLGAVSPAALFAIERGNTDMLAFVLHGNTALGPMSYGAATLISALGHIAMRTGVPGPVLLVTTAIVMAAALGLAFRVCPSEAPTDAHSRALFLTGSSI